MNHLMSPCGMTWLENLGALLLGMSLERFWYARSTVQAGPSQSVVLIVLVPGVCA